MDFLLEIMKEQNKNLLEKIADDKFNTLNEKRDFINKYDKTNYKKFIEVKEKNIEYHIQILNAFNIKV
jgi:hypothetical protein